MYQIAASLIHDRHIDQKHDSDSFVHGIADLSDAIAAVVDYAHKLGFQYDLTFTMGADHSPERPFSLWAHAPHMVTGDATFYVEVQLTPIRTDVDLIVQSLVTSARYSNPMLREGA